MSAPGGTNTFQPTFGGGSPPNALVVATTNVSGRATATAATIDFAAHRNKTITIDFSFDVAKAATTVEYLGRLNFATQSSPIGLSGGNTLQCGGAAFALLAAGVHAISLGMAVDGTGSVTNFTCSLDGSMPVGAPVAASKTLSFELGNVMSGSGQFTVSYDNVVVRAR